MTTCPFLVPVVADRLWLYPIAAYCRRPDARVRVPGATTLADVCTTWSHRACPGYRDSASRPTDVTPSGEPPATDTVTRNS